MALIDRDYMNRRTRKREDDPARYDPRMFRRAPDPLPASALRPSLTTTRSWRAAQPRRVTLSMKEWTVVGLVILLAAVAVSWGLYQVSRWLGEWNNPRGGSTAAVVTETAGGREGPWAFDPPRAGPGSAVAATPGTAGGYPPSAQAAAPASPPPRNPSGARGNTPPAVLNDGVPITKCSGGGRVSYSQDGRCPAGQSPVDLRLRPLAGVADADRAKTNPKPNPKPDPKAASPAANPPARKATAQERTPPAADASTAPLTPCQSLAAGIDRIDRQSRQPQNGARQDQLRAERQLLRERQVKLGC
jgi:hypothetical protein